MASTGPVFPGTGENNSGIGATAWTNPTNVVSDNAADATCNAGASSQYLVVRNFGLAVPAGATISGITIRVEASEHSPGNETLNARLQDQSGALVGSTKTNTLSGTAKSVYVYGGTSDLWGTTLTDAIVNDADFGVRLWFSTSHDVRIDYVTLAVEYVPVAVGGGLFPGVVFPGEVFPAPVFPGTGVAQADVTVSLSGVEAGAAGLIIGAVFPGEVFPGGVFPSPVFPSGLVGDTGGVGTVLPSTTKALTANPVTGHAGFVTAGNDSVAVLTGVGATVSVGTVVQSLAVAVSGNAAATAVGLVRADLPLSAVAATVSLGTGVPEIAVVLSGVAGTTAVGLVAVFPEGIALLSGVGAIAEVGSVVAVPDREQSLTGIALTATAGNFNLGQPVVISGVGATAGVGTLEAHLFTTLSPVIATGRVGHTPSGNDVIVDLEGVTAGVGDVGILGVAPQMPFSLYRHTVPAPIRRRAPRDLVELEREHALMED